MDRSRLWVVGAVLLVGCVTTNGMAAFTPGNLVIYRVGDGTAPLTGSGTQVFLDEYITFPSVMPVQTVAMPIVASGGNRPLVASGSATSEGLLTRSTNGQYLLLTGYNAPVGYPSVVADTSAATNRTVGRVDSLGNVDTTTALTDFASTSNARSAASTDGVSIWVGGGAGAVRYTTLGSTTSTQLNTTPTNVRQVNIFDGQLYVSSGSSPFIGVNTVGSGLPTGGTNTVALLPGIASGDSTSPYGFFFADLSPGVAGVDTLYVANDSGVPNNLIRKYSFNGLFWTATGSVAVTGGVRGLTGAVSGSVITLYGTNPSTLLSVTDTSGFNGMMSGVPVTLATAPTNTAFRGVAFAPVPEPMTLILLAGGALFLLRRR